MDRPETENRSKINAWRMLSGAAGALFVATLLACGGGTSVAASGEITQTQFNTLLASSQAWKDMQTQLTKDEATIKSQGDLIASGLRFGHFPGAHASKSVAGRSTMVFNPHTGIFEAVDFGPCPNMGTPIGTSGPDPAGASVGYHQQCLINGVRYIYGTNNDGTTHTADKIWFANNDCTGEQIEFDNGEMYNGETLRNGVVFHSPKDGSLEKVAGGQTGSSMTSHSDYSGVCVVEDVTSTGYIVDPATLQGTGVPEAVPATWTDD